MSLENYVYLVYCKECGVILIDYKESMIEYHTYSRFWTEDGILETGETDCYDVEANTKVYPVCSLCNKETKLSLTMEKKHFLLILKHCYKNDPYKIIKGFKIELKENPNNRSQMIAPILQEIKEAIVVNAI